ncbi:DUF2937 family protein [Thalassotalea profundi]|uniref:DUF2937 family protein n=1 Tax=Thalassotalea profundi TaxID=2036687 RepID=A0ABQ3J5H6_9GAMM|nr:DUF2937 family protein [Thalassotalea profundi]GHF01173.1 hypothetical protein GCM10011501_33260 [Thalassotalea profundi]
MFKLIFNLIDKTLFTLMFIIGIQIPAFINAYRQYLSGQLNEAKEHLTQYQLIADMQYQGSLEQLITAFKNNTDKAIQQMSTVISHNVESVNAYQQQLFNLENGSYVQRIFYFVAHIDLEKASDTLIRFVPAIPLELNAIITGVFLSLLLSTLLNTLYLSGKKLLTTKVSVSTKNA